MTRTPRQAGFTLTELMVAVLILVVVIVATSKIFGTVSRVTGVGAGDQPELIPFSSLDRTVDRFARARRRQHKDR